MSKISTVGGRNLGNKSSSVAPLMFMNSSLVKELWVPSQKGGLKHKTKQNNAHQHVHSTILIDYPKAYADHYLDIANKWELKKKLITLGTDSARNMVAAARLLPFEHLPCTAHSLQRTVIVSLGDSGFESALAKCPKIVGHFEHSPSNTQELKEEQESLAQDVATRWNSMLEMVKRIQRNKAPLTTTLAQQNSKVAMLADQELAKLQKLEELLEPCRYVTELLWGEQYVSCSVVLPALRHLFRIMEPSDDNPVYVVRFKKVITTEQAQRKDNTNLSWLKIATALDPRFKDLKCLPKDERSEVWASVRDLVMGETHAQPSPAEPTEEPSPKKGRCPSCWVLPIETHRAGFCYGQCGRPPRAQSMRGRNLCALKKKKTKQNSAVF